MSDKLCSPSRGNLTGGGRGGRGGVRGGRGEG